MDAIGRAILASLGTYVRGFNAPKEDKVELIEACINMALDERLISVKRMREIAKKHGFDLSP
jgi:hypothetical protein